MWASQLFFFLHFISIWLLLTKSEKKRNCENRQFIIIIIWNLSMYFTHTWMKFLFHIFVSYLSYFHSFYNILLYTLSPVRRQRTSLYSVGTSSFEKYVFFIYGDFRDFYSRNFFFFASVLWCKKRKRNLFNYFTPDNEIVKSDTLWTLKDLNI